MAVLNQDRLRVCPGTEAALQTENLLGVVGFQAGRPSGLDPAIPFVQVPMPALDGRPYEAWYGGGPVRYGQSGSVTYADDGALRFAAMCGQGGPILAEAEHLYRALLGVAETDPVLRFWNYIPAITEDEAGTERYRLFNQGRGNAFAALRPEWQQPPAASALGSLPGGPVGGTAGGPAGSTAGPAVALMLAARQGGTPIENPRQISAYRYPAQYGPTSPSFSRALLARPGLFISGTASITGHESRHIGDVQAQIRETIRNLNTLLAEAGQRGFQPDPGGLQCKAYLRDPADLPVVRAELAAAFPQAPPPVFLQADICRQELLVEVEAFATPAA